MVDLANLERFNGCIGLLSSIFGDDMIIYAASQGV